MKARNEQAATLDELRRQAARLRVVVARVDAELPSLAESKGFRSASEELAWAEKLLHPERRAVIGLFGAPQVGKTSTLAAAFTDAVGPPLTEPAFRIGVGQQVDKILKRIRRAQEGQAPALEYNYLTPQEYQARRRAVLQRVAFDPSLSDEIILARIEQLLASGSDKPDVALLDLRDAAHLLRSYQRHGAQFVCEPRLVLKAAPETTADRDAALDASAPVDRLLREINAYIVLDRMPTDVDYVELPFQLESISTEIQLLDGIVVFVRADCLETREISDFWDFIHAARLRPSSIALVVTKMDLLHAREEASAEQGFEAHFLATLDRWNVSPQRVSLVAMPWWGPHRHQGMQAWEVPLRFHQPEFAAAFTDTVRDGGVGRVQTVLFEQLPQQIFDAIQKQAAARLQSALEQLRYLLEMARQQRPRLDWYDRAVRWRNLVAGLDDEVLSQALLDTLDSDLTEILAKRFDLLCPEKVVVKGQDLHRAHERAAAQLSDALALSVGAEIWPGVAELVAKKLAASESDPDLGKLPLSGSATTVGESWGAEAAESGSQSPFLAAAERFVEPPLFPADAPPFLTGEAYRHLMQEKISLVAQQAVLAVAREVRGRLQQLRNRLEDLLDGVGQVPLEQASVVDELLSALR